MHKRVPASTTVLGFFMLISSLNRLIHPRINNRDPVLVICDPAKLSPTFLAPSDRNHLGGALGNFNQLAITAELGEEIAMQHTNLQHLIIPSATPSSPSNAASPFQNLACLPWLRR